MGENHSGRCWVKAADVLVKVADAIVFFNLKRPMFSKNEKVRVREKLGYN